VSHLDLLVGLGWLPPTLLLPNREDKALLVRPGGKAHRLLLGEARVPEGGLVGEVIRLLKKNTKKRIRKKVPKN